MCCRRSGESRRSYGGGRPTPRAVPLACATPATTGVCARRRSVLLPVCQLLLGADARQAGCTKPVGSVAPLSVPLCNPGSGTDAACALTSPHSAPPHHRQVPLAACRLAVVLDRAPDGAFWRDPPLQADAAVLVNDGPFEDLHAEAVRRGARPVAGRDQYTPIAVE